MHNLLPCRQFSKPIFIFATSVSCNFAGLRGITVSNKTDSFAKVNCSQHQTETAAQMNMNQFPRVHYTNWIFQFSYFADES